KGEKPDSKSAMNVAVEKVLAKESVKAMLKATTIAEMGPAQERPSTPTGDDGDKVIYIPKATAQK
ncbi:MAG TPA: hypothetical protein PLZ51_17415, partial [Aggregatilineales bacterium]|nr:hypothetical protein [Aggregatilineales bacterium]